MVVEFLELFLSSGRLFAAGIGHQQAGQKEGKCTVSSEVSHIIRLTLTADCITYHV